jgi:mannose-6-phosphate isomerase-like protein (cupin superfamily)
MKASGRSTGGSLTVIEFTVDEGPSKHTHTREDESFYVFTGALQVECGEDTFEAGPGSFVFLARNLAHTFRSIGGPATALLIVTPGGLDEYFAELHAALGAGGGRAEIALPVHTATPAGAEHSGSRVGSHRHRLDVLWFCGNQPAARLRPGGGRSVRDARNARRDRPVLM